MKATVTELLQGLNLGLSNNKQVRDAAQQFMKDNGYKLTPQGKDVAISELESLAESEEYPADMVIAISTAIVTL